jgi:decaprenylphospho-beta-D-ribofuranose 2-oxidase
MTALALAPLRTQPSWRVLDGFGRSVVAACRHVTPRSVEELARTFESARAAGLTVAFRGSGRSYGDAALNSEGVVIDATQIKRVLAWDPEHGSFECEPGVTIEGLWRRIIQDGYWPAVVPGTMRPTLGGCLAMNVHGKNNYKVGPFGDHVDEIDLLTPRGELLTCSRTQNADVFFAALGGLGLLGAITRVKLHVKKVHSGYLRVNPLAAHSLDSLCDQFEVQVKTSDYCVGWVDCFARGGALGRGEIHAANYLEPGEDPEADSSLRVEHQGLPPSILGFPRSQIWKIMRLTMNDPGVAFVNWAKYRAACWAHGRSYLQSHVAFAFLLDYVPDWRLAYGPSGFIQYQVFVPYAGGRETLKDVLRICQEHGMPSYLGVLKRHRPDDYVLSHAMDGWSMAMDFRVQPGKRDRLLAMTHALTERVVAAGGRFYFAKDSVLDAGEVARAYGPERLGAFAAMKQRLDPEGLLVSDLARRALPGVGAPA